MKQPGKAFGSGIAGAAIVTIVNETLRQFVPQAPRMEQLGMQAISKLLSVAGQPTPENKNTLYGQALAGDLVSNSLFYSLAGVGKRPWITGLLMGVGAGVAAVTLPKYLGLEDRATNRTPETTAMTIALYTLGGLAAAGVASLLSESKTTKVPASAATSNYIDVDKLVQTQRQNIERSWNLKD